MRDAELQLKKLSKSSSTACLQVPKIGSGPAVAMGTVIQARPEITCLNTCVKTSSLSVCAKTLKQCGSTSKSCIDPGETLLRC